VKAPVLEVILDPGTADPSDPPVDDRDLAMVDVPELGEVQADDSRPSESPAGARACIARTTQTSIPPVRKRS
jgi:hypothetical protein